MKKSFCKKMQKKFKVGDIVTWGNGSVSHRIIEVQKFGVIVDATSQNFGNLFVSFDNNNRNRSGRGPIQHSSAEPDKVDVTIV